MPTLPSPLPKASPQRRAAPDHSGRHGVLLAAGLAAALVLGACAAGASPSPSSPAAPFEAPPATASALPDTDGTAAALCSTGAPGSIDDLAATLRGTDLTVDAAAAEARLSEVAVSLSAMSMEGAAAEVRDEAVAALAEVGAQLTAGAVEQDATDRAATALEDLSAQIC